jgi:CRP-like cAMP-binding protein
VVISLMGSGALIGDLALLSPEPIRTVDVVSLTAVTLLKLRDGALKEALENSATALALIAGLQAQRLKVLGERLMLMHEDATTRLLATLLELARLNGSADDPHQPIPAISQNEIAAIAGLSRGTTSTLINKLRSNGTLENGVEGLHFATLAPLQRRGLLPIILPPPG